MTHIGILADYLYDRNWRIKMEIKFKDSKLVKTLVGFILYDENKNKIGEVTKVEDDIVTAKVTNTRFYERSNKGRVTFSTVDVGIDKLIMDFKAIAK